MYLGRPFGYEEKCSSQKVIDDTSTMISQLASSGLSPSQTFDSIISFALPKMSYVFRVGDILNAYLEKFDNSLRNTARTIFSLPSTASNHFFQSPRAGGGLGLTASSDLRACALVSQACRVLDPSTSPFAAIFRQELCLQTQCDSFEDALEKLQLPTASALRGTTRFLSSGRWTEVASALKHLRRSISVSISLVDDSITLSIGNLNGPTVPTTSKQFYRSLRLAISDFHLKCLLALTQQGRSYSLISRNPLSSHFMRSGNIRYSDWEFIFKARLDLLSTGPTRSRYHINNHCSRCARDQENLYHIMSSCMSSSALRTHRHNCIALRVVRAICFSVRATINTAERIEAAFWKHKTNSMLLAPDREILWNCAVRASGVMNVHCDVAYIDRRCMRAFVIDVRVSYEADANSFNIARVEKITTYQPVLAGLRRAGFHSTLYPFIVGALGAWDEKNNKLFSDLHLSTRCKKFFTKLCVRDAIGGSADIWSFHISGNPPSNLYQPLYQDGTGWELVTELSDRAHPPLDAADGTTATVSLPSGPRFSALKRRQPMDSNVDRPPFQRGRFDMRRDAASASTRSTTSGDASSSSSTGPSASELSLMAATRALVAVANAFTSIIQPTRFAPYATHSTLFSVPSPLSINTTVPSTIVSSFSANSSRSSLSSTRQSAQEHQGGRPEDTETQQQLHWAPRPIITPASCARRTTESVRPAQEPATDTLGGVPQPPRLIPLQSTSLHCSLIAPAYAGRWDSFYGCGSSSKSLVAPIASSVCTRLYSVSLLPMTCRPSGLAPATAATRLSPPLRPPSSSAPSRPTPGCAVYMFIARTIS